MSSFFPIILDRKSSIAISNCRLPIANFSIAALIKLAIGNWQSAMTSFLPVLKRNRHQRYRIRIILLLAFELQQVPIRTTFCYRKLSAHRGPRVIDRAATCFVIEELASLSKQRIALAA